MLQATKPKRHYKAGKPNKQLPHLDGRSKASHRFRTLCKLFTADLGREPTAAESALVRQAAASVVASEQIQGRVLAGTASMAEVKELSRLGNLSTRCLISLKLANKACLRSVGALDAYLKGKP